MRSGMTSFVTWGPSPRSREFLRRGRTKARRAAFEVLEGRITPTTFLVVNALDGPGAGPSGSLRNAIARADQSGAAATIVITPKVGGPIDLNAGELTIDASLTILNRSGGPVEIRQTTPGDRVIDVSSNPLAARVNLAGASRRETLTISGGSVATGNGGGILVEDPANVLTLTNVRIVGNSAGLASSPDGSQDGGGIYSSGRIVLVRSTVGTADAPDQTSGDGGGIWAGAGVSMTASSVVGNQAGGAGGGLFVSSGDTLVSRSQVDGNRALDIGGIDEIKGDVRVVGGEVNGNSSTASLDVGAGNFGGGGISVGIGNVFVSRGQVSHNHSVGMYSSGIVIGLGGVTVTSGSQIDWNSNNGPGGGIAANFGGTVTVSGHSQVDHNTGSGNGGGIVNFAGPLGGVRILGGSEVSHNTLTNYESLGQAVGVFLEALAGSLNLDFTAATGGTSASGVAAEIAQVEQEVSSASPTGGSSASPSGFVVSGGGIGTLLGASITVAGGSKVDDNLSGSQVLQGNPRSIGIGGGLFSGLGAITIGRSTVSGNTSLGAGGGIWNRGALSAVGSTIAGNTAALSPGGGLYNSAGATASILRGTVRDNRASLGGGVANKGNLTLVRTPVVANTPDNIAQLS